MPGILQPSFFQRDVHENEGWWMVEQSILEQSKLPKLIVYRLTLWLLGKSIFLYSSELLPVTLRISTGAKTRRLLFGDVFVQLTVKIQSLTALMKAEGRRWVCANYKDVAQLLRQIIFHDNGFRLRKRNSWVFRLVTYAHRIHVCMVYLPTIHQFHVYIYIFILPLKSTIHIDKHTVHPMDARVFQEVLERLTYDEARRFHRGPQTAWPVECSRFPLCISIIACVL